MSWSCRASRTICHHAMPPQFASISTVQLGNEVNTCHRAVIIFIYVQVLHVSAAESPGLVPQSRHHASGCEASQYHDRPLSQAATPHRLGSCRVLLPREGVQHTSCIPLLQGVPQSFTRVSLSCSNHPIEAGCF